MSLFTEPHSPQTIYMVASKAILRHLINVPLLLTFLILSCTHIPENLDKIDSFEWASDKNGCLGLRLKSLKELEATKDQLKGLTQEQTINFLGKPDKKEIFKRRQQLFTYYISGSESCQDKKTSPVYLQIRFNALGKSDEVIVIQ